MISFPMNDGPLSGPEFFKKAAEEAGAPWPHNKPDAIRSSLGLTPELDYYSPTKPPRDPWPWTVIIALYVVLAVLIGILYHHHV